MDRPGPLQVEGERWAWAIPMRSFEGNFGHVVIAGERPVPQSEQFLLRVLAQQLGMRHRERRQPRT